MLEGASSDGNKPESHTKHPHSDLSDSTRDVSASHGNDTSQPSSNTEKLKLFLKVFFKKITETNNRVYNLVGKMSQQSVLTNGPAFPRQGTSRQGTLVINV